MNYFRTFIFIIFLLTACTNKSVRYISTALALEKYKDFLKNKSFLAFLELREKPIKYYDSISKEEILRTLYKSDFILSAQPGEYYVYQVGVWALKSEVKNIQVEFSDLTCNNGVGSISANVMTCFNTKGIDFKGNSFSKIVNIPAGRVQALWMGLDLENVRTGTYFGTISISSGREKQIIPIHLSVSGKIIPDHGYNKDKRLSRLNWLNSIVGIDKNVTKGYLPIKVEGEKVTILGRTLNISDDGLPSSIISYFNPSNQSFIENGKPIVKNPIRFIIEKADGEIINLQPEPLEFLERTPSKITWKVLNISKECDLKCTAQMNYDGFIEYKLKLSAKAHLNIKDIRLEIPIIKEKAEYMMGLGHEGGFRISNWKWKWDSSKNQDMLWVGTVNGGLRIHWTDENYIRPLINIFYKFRPLRLPPSWNNKGKGGVNIMQKNENVLINAYSGSRKMAKGDTLNFNFSILITPFRLIDKKKKFGDRYYADVETNTFQKIKIAKKIGANIIDIHHGADILPYINYPYLDECIEELISLISNAHKEGLRLRLYYTKRLLSINIPEFWAFYSLNGEIIFPGPGNETQIDVIWPNGPDEWFTKNLREKYIPGWHNTIRGGKFNGKTDLSVVTTPDSRLNNFFVSGLDWMVKNLSIDGIYLDDTDLDRYTLQRVRKIFDRSCPEPRIDLHSWNHFNKWGGFASCLNLYMDLLPYVDLVWIGEGRDYNRSPDHWLIEVSGIPFGTGGQMLQSGGNPWRGMVYGITARAGWKGTPPPTSIWNFWDDHKFESKEMIGYWDKNNPVTCNNPLVKATVYKGIDEAIIAIANWNQKNEKASLKVNWVNLGLNPMKCDIFIPEIKDFQTKQKSISLKEITIPGGKGYLILLIKNKM